MYFHLKISNLQLSFIRSVIRSAVGKGWDIIYLTSSDAGHEIVIFDLFTSREYS